jgi:hypothetical protein
MYNSLLFGLSKHNIRSLAKYAVQHNCWQRKYLTAPYEGVVILLRTLGHVNNNDNNNILMEYFASTLLDIIYASFPYNR